MYITQSTKIFKKHLLTKEFFHLIFSRNYQVHPDLIGIWQTCCCSFLIGGLYGGFKYSRAAFINFIETNEATQFKSHLDAKRKLADKQFLALMKGGLAWGPRVCFFCTSFV